MSGHNPYAPTQASLQSAESVPAAGGLWRDDNRLIVAHGATFPHRCVKCNEPSEAPQKPRKVYWHHPAIYILVFGYAILYIIVALIVRRSAEINPGLCAEHRERRALWIAIGWLGSFGGAIAAIVLAQLLNLDGGLGAALAILVFFFFAILGIVKARVLYPKRIDDRYARLMGADERFLASLPQFMAL
jgi:hypothetical protein